MDHQLDTVPPGFRHPDSGIRIRLYYSPVPPIVRGAQPQLFFDRGSKIVTIFCSPAPKYMGPARSRGTFVQPPERANTRIRCMFVPRSASLKLAEGAPSELKKNLAS